MSLAYPHTSFFSIYYLFTSREKSNFFFLKKKKKKNRGRCRGTDVECFVRDENWPRRVPKLDMKKYIMNQGESDPADGLTAFDGIQPDPVLSQDVKVQDRMLLLLMMLKSGSAWSSR